MQLSIISQEFFIKELIEQLNISMLLKHYTSFSELTKEDIFNTDIIISTEDISDSNLYYTIVLGKKQFTYPIKTHEFLKYLKYLTDLVSTSIFKLNDEIKLNINNKTVKLKSDSNVINLLPKESNILELFAKSKEPITKEFLLETIWDITNPDITTATVETHIYRLRKKHPALNSLIKHDGTTYHL